MNNHNNGGTTMTAAEYAAILDPERKVEGWWRFSIYRSQPCGWFKFRTETTQPNLPNDGTYKIYDEGYHGPDDLHTARSEAWRGEEWLEARNIGWIRHMTETLPAITCVMIGHASIKPEKVCNTDHAAAIAEAVRRVHRGR